MTEWRNAVANALDDFVVVAALAGNQLNDDELFVEYLEMPHLQPKRLPPGKMAVYGFWGFGEWLKIGKAGPKSNARYTSQHYHPGRSKSNLSDSLVRDPRMAIVDGFDKQNPGQWVTQRTHRVNILISKQKHKTLLSLLEVFLQARLKPRYEG